MSKYWGSESSTEADVLLALYYPYLLDSEKGGMEGFRNFPRSHRWQWYSQDLNPLHVICHLPGASPSHVHWSWTSDSQTLWFSVINRVKRNFPHVIVLLHDYFLDLWEDSGKFGAPIARFQSLYEESPVSGCLTLCATMWWLHFRDPDRTSAWAHNSGMVDALPFDSAAHLVSHRGFWRLWEWGGQPCGVASDTWLQ